MLAGTTAGEAAGLLAVAEAVPVADLGVEGGEGEGAQALGKDLSLDPGQGLGLEFPDLLLEDEEDLPEALEDAEFPGVEVAEALPVPRAPPVGGERGVTVFGDEAVGAVGQAADLPCEELASAGGLAPALFVLGGDADGLELVVVAVDPADEALAEGACVELVGLATAVEGDGGDEEGLGAGGDEFAVEDEAEAAGLLDAEDLEALGDPVPDPLEKFLPGVVSADGQNQPGVVESGGMKTSQ